MGNKDKSALKEREGAGSRRAMSSLSSKKEESTQHYDYVFRRALRLTHNVSDAEEITQQAFLRCLRHMEEKEWKVKAGSLKTYLAKIVDDLYEDMLKRREEKPASIDDKHTREAAERAALQDNDSIASIENHIFIKELYRVLPLKVILRDLTDFDLQLISKRFIDGMSVKEIAETVGKDVNEVRYVLDKLVAKIRFRARKLGENAKSGETANELMFSAWKQIYAKRDRFGN